MILLGARSVLTAIKQVCGLKAEIKKPNDVFLNGKKVAGILVERVDTASDIPSVIIGIGLNVNTTSFPPELKEKATSLKLVLNKEINRIRVLETLIEALDKGYLKFLKGSV